MLEGGQMIDFVQHRKVIEQYYQDRATIYESKRMPDAKTGASVMKKTVLYENVPCHLDWGTSTTMMTAKETKAEQNISVLLAPELIVPTGSMMEITTQAGRTHTFKASTLASVVPSHQEIGLELVVMA